MMKKRFMIIILIVVVLVGAFIGWLAFAWRSDVSKDSRFAPYLNRPIVIKDTATLVWLRDVNRFRFKPYSFGYRENSQYNEAELKSVKHFLPGDVIQFHKAQSYYNLFVGTTYYFIGREKLPNGEEIEYEYYSSDTWPAPWETVEEFVGRKERDKNISGD
jgi:hypothetical protein